MPNILIADDHDLVRDAIAAYVGNVDEFNVESVSTADDAIQALHGVIPFDLAIFDYNMPGMNGLMGLESAIKKFPKTKFALMSGVAKPDVAKDAMSMGASGFFPKSLAADTMVNAIRFVLSGERYFPFDLSMTTSGADAPGDYHGLTAREKQTLEGLCAGQSNKEIARDLDLQEVTIKLHVKNILQKMGVKNRTQAALRARDEGFI